MKIELEQQLNGFRASWRNKHSNLQHLRDGEFRLLEIYVDLAIWDKINYKETYGTTGVTNVTIAQVWGCGESKVSRWKKKLLKREGLIREREDGRIEILNFSKYEVKKAYTLAKLSKTSVLAEMQEVGAKMQDSHTNADSDTGYKTCADTGRNRDGLAKMQAPLPSKGLISSKSNLSTAFQKKGDFGTFAKGAMAELKRNDPLEAGGRALPAEEMVAGGFPLNTLYKPCPICKSAIDFIDCCGPAMFESLKGVKG